MACLFSSTCGKRTIVNVDSICDALTKRIATQQLQARIYFTQAQEHALRASLCVNESDRIGARQFLLERNKARERQRLELSQMSNLLEIREQLERTRRDLETGQLLSGASVSLSDLLERMPDLQQVMDDLQKGSYQVMEHSEMLAMTPAPSSEADEALDDEISLLMTQAMPIVFPRSNLDEPFIVPVAKPHKCLVDEEPY